MSLLGTEKHKNCGELARQLTFESSAIITEIDRCLLGECKFGATLSLRVNELKMQNNKVLALVAVCEKNKKATEAVRFELNNFEFCIRNLEVEINNERSKHPDECHNKLTQIQQSLVRLRGCVGTAVGSIW